MLNNRLATGVALLVWAAAACGSAKPSASASATPIPAPPAVAATGTAAGDFAAGGGYKLAGDTWFNSEAIKLDTETTLKIAWDYKGQGPFAIWLVNTAEEVLDPNYDRILITDAPGATSGSTEQNLIPGEYELEVELADGPWTVEIRPVSP